MLILDLGRLPDRFRKKFVINPRTGCWDWHGTISTGGYGRYRPCCIQGRRINVAAHRLAYESLIGPIVDGLTIDHLCRNRACVNPAHMEPVTRGENVLRGLTIGAANKRKTHCKWGHPFDEANTYRVQTPNGRMGRQCRACQSERSRKRDRAGYYARYLKAYRQSPRGKAAMKRWLAQRRTKLAAAKAEAMEGNHDKNPT